MKDMAVDADSDEGAIEFDDDGEGDCVKARVATTTEGEGEGTVVEKDTKGGKKKKEKKEEKKKKNIFFLSWKGHYREGQEINKKEEEKIMLFEMKLYYLRLNCIF